MSCWWVGLQDESSKLDCNASALVMQCMHAPCFLFFVFCLVKDDAIGRGTNRRTGRGDSTVSMRILNYERPSR